MYIVLVAEAGVGLVRLLHGLDGVIRLCGQSDQHLDEGLEISWLKVSQKKYRIVSMKKESLKSIHQVQSFYFKLGSHF